MLRSEKIERIMLYFRNEDLKESVSRIGSSSLVHFVDPNDGKKADDLPFSKELKTIEKLEQRMNYFKREININGDVENAESNHSFEEVKSSVDKYYDKLVELRHTQKDLQRLEQVLEENYVMVAESRRFLQAAVEDKDFAINFDFATAIADRDKKFLIKKTLRHRLRRNIFIKMIDVELESIARQRTVFVIYVLGNEAFRIAKDVFESLNGRMYNREYPADTKDAKKKHAEKVFNRDDCGKKDGQSMGNDTGCQNNNLTDNNMIPDQNEVLDYKNDLKALKFSFKNMQKLNNRAKRHISEFLKKAENNYIKWKFYINKEKKIFETMNRLQKQENTDCLLGEGWVLKGDIEKLYSIKGSDKDRGKFTFEPIKTDETRPTHFKLTTYTEAFQGFTNVFGIPKYREVNPAIFLIFTFPFMFGAMFGDILHGLFLGLIALSMIFNFEKFNHKCGVFQIILEGRYVVFACALSAIWFGLLYGDFGSLPVAMFSSQYDVDRTYPFGIDPMWHHADNKTIFINSVKMKLSLIIGFMHMSLGSLISIWNAIYFKDKITLICVAIPQFIVFTLFLGYLVFLCVFKWLVTSNYPSLVNTLIGMYTSPFNIVEPMYPGQLYVQLFILSIILVCIPWMFLSKPFYLILKRRIPREGLLDLWITSGIHVVEFGLGLISNTSSYLRLWAVSLAHVQLTAVLHQFTIGNESWIISILLLPIYVACTLMLLIGLEGLSACLHALRLNWIEFFSKFYTGGGVAFEPFTFKLNYEDIYEEPD